MFGHRFEARYSCKDVESQLFTAEDITKLADITDYKNRANDIVTIIESLKNNSSEKIYIHDVCTRCGKVIKQE